MPIIFEGSPPFETLVAHRPSAEPTLDGVRLVLNVAVDGHLGGSVPVLVLLEPEDARALAGQMGAASTAVENWRKSQGYP
jgi:hypothetical protein